MNILRFSVRYVGNKPVEIRWWKAASFGKASYTELRKQAVSRHCEEWRVRAFETPTGYYIEYTNPATLWR